MKEQDGTWGKQVRTEQVGTKHEKVSIRFVYSVHLAQVDRANPN